jgi:Xaa-Pro aminopeptidase
MNARRLSVIRQHIIALRLDALLVSFPPFVRYLTGFTGSNACCIIAPRIQSLVTDGRYTTQVHEEVRDFRIFIAKGGLFEELRSRRLLPSKGRVGFNPSQLHVSELENLKSLFPGVKFIKTRDIVGAATAIKDAVEVQNIRAAARISDDVFRHILGVVKEGISELDIAAELAYQHRKRGAEADAFEPIVASGIRGCLPHARAGTKRIKKGELVTLDFGCRLNGYHSDLTRTVAVGKPRPELRKIYRTVQDAQQRAVEAAKGGMKARDLDAVARTWIKKAGFGRYFTHSLGHGLGLQVHEGPRVSAKSPDRIQSGNVITIEPGVYVPGVGGVRIEDDIVIRDGFAETLTTSPKELIIL